MESLLETYFKPFREGIIGLDFTIPTPYGEKKIVYADWIASGRLYGPIEQKMLRDFGPFVANTHSEASFTGRFMTEAYNQAKRVIKEHVNASDNDVIITADSGMTGVLCKFQRILGMKYPETLLPYMNEIPEKDRPVVFLTHMEHHSNHTTWLETIADVVVLEPDQNLTVDVGALRSELERYADRKVKIGSFTACSNVTGVFTPYHEMAEVMHEHGGLCFVDFAAAAPYTTIDMHPTKESQRLDAVFFSPHKFLGGPGSSGVLVFDSSLYKNRIPDHPGGGTVTWTNPWGEHAFATDIEVREDGGTPAFLQTIRAALSINLKKEMGVDKIRQREEELINTCFSILPNIKQIKILAGDIRERLGVISFYSEHVHFNLMVAILNDRYGIQVRGGCSCAGTYGHVCLNVSRSASKMITDRIDSGDLSAKPGWVRLSLHPTMTNSELCFIMDAIREISENIDEMERDYDYDPHTNEFVNKRIRGPLALNELFDMSNTSIGDSLLNHGLL